MTLSEKRQSSHKENNSRAAVDLRLLQKMRGELESKPRDLLLFDLLAGSVVGLKRLLLLRAKDLFHLEIGDPLPVPSFSGGSISRSVLTKKLFDTFQSYCEKVRPAAEDYLFPSRKGKGPLTLSSASHLISKWFKDAGINSLSGARILQNTWKAPSKEGSGKVEKAGYDSEPESRLQPLEVKTVQEGVYGELLEAITSGRIRPGEKLMTQKISRRMGVSPMPVRQALNRLEAAGFVFSKKKRGMIVKELSRENLEEITEIRLTLESMAARKAAMARDNKTLKRLEDLHRRFLKARKDHEMEDFLRLNREFHHTIYQEANMPTLLQIIESLWHRVSPYLHILMREGGYSESAFTIKTHTEMLNGMKQSNPEQVVTNLRADLTNAAQVIMRMFDHS